MLGPLWYLHLPTPQLTVRYVGLIIFIHDSLWASWLASVDSHSRHIGYSLLSLLESSSSRVVWPGPQRNYATNVELANHKSFTKTAFSVATTDLSAKLQHCRSLRVCLVTDNRAALSPVNSYLGLTQAMSRLWPPKVQFYDWLFYKNHIL